MRTMVNHLMAKDPHVNEWMLWVIRGNEDACIAYTRTNPYSPSCMIGLPNVDELDAFERVD